MHDVVLTRARSHHVQIRTDTVNSEREHLFMNMRTAFTANPDPNCTLPDSHTTPTKKPNRLGLCIGENFGAGDPDAGSSSVALRAPKLEQASGSPAR